MGPLALPVMVLRASGEGAGLPVAEASVVAFMTAAATTGVVLDFTSAKPGTIWGRCWMAPKAMP